MKQWIIDILTKWLKNLSPEIFVEKQVLDNNKDTNPIEPETKQEPSEKPKQSQEDYWNNKWPRKDITYYGRILKHESNKSAAFFNMAQLAVDVKAFILDNDSVMKHIVKTYKLRKDTDDETMFAIQRFVCEGTMDSFYATGYYEPITFSAPENKKTRPVLTYVDDVTTNDAVEYWQFPFETIMASVGDCEDGAILIAALAINAGIPSYKVKVAVGNVSNRFLLNPNAPSFKDVPMGKYNANGLSEGGHAYCIYLASDNEWRIVDWCYYQDYNVPVLNKPLAKQGGNGCYFDTWFTFNNQYAWNQSELDVNVARLGDIYEKTELDGE